MLMKSVIINLKYLIFRSVSATEGGCLEERQRRRGGNVWGLRGWGGVEAEELCCSVSLICIRCFKDGSNRSARAVAFFFFFCSATC